MSDSLSRKPQETVLGEIALSLSGGGYRAAAFHLGTFSMLDRLGLLDDVRVLSTVSGGTIAGASWAKSLADHTPFAEFLPAFKRFLIAINVVQEALRKLPLSVDANGLQVMPSLIRAAADVYSSSDLLGDKRFGCLKVPRTRNANEDSAKDDGFETDEDGDLVADELEASDLLVEDAGDPDEVDGEEKPTTQLTDIAFNATDFRTGNSFRFQQSGSRRVRSGNNKGLVNPVVNDRIRLADIVAASSCFPTGFEPMRFPSDFDWGGPAEIADVRFRLGKRFRTEIGLMDGGVFDNQGMDSISLVYKRKDRLIGLYIISDTSQRDPIHLETPVAPLRGRITVKQISWLLWLLMAAAIVTFVAIARDAYLQYSTAGLTLFVWVFHYLVPLVFSGGVAFLLYKIRSMTQRFLREFKAESGVDAWAGFAGLSVPAALEIAESRLRSVIAMSKSVFMKRIRDLGYKRIFGNQDFENRRISNIIYDLDNKGKWGPAVQRYGLEPSPRLRQLARDAEAYPTNLWFTKPSELDSLVACGEATMCFNLLRFLGDCREKEIADPTTPEHELFSKALDFWKTLK